MAEKKQQNEVQVVPLKASELRQRIFEADDVKLVEHEVKEWGVTVWLKPLSYDERNECYKSAGMIAGTETTAEQTASFTMAVVLKSVVDSNGNPVFTKDDVGVLQQKSSAAIDGLVFKIADISGFGADVRSRLQESTT